MNKTTSPGSAKSTPSKSPRIKYSYVNLAQAYSNRLKQTDQHVFGVIIQSSKFNDNIVIKDETGAEIDVHLEKNDFQSTANHVEILFHLGDIFRLHRLRYSNQLRSFTVRYRDIVVFKSFISTQTRTAFISHVSKNPTITPEDHERAFDLDRWYAEHISASPFASINVNSKYINLAGQLLAIQHVKQNIKVICIWDCTSLPIPCKNPYRLYNPSTDMIKDTNFDLVSDSEKAYVVVYDTHADSVGEMQPGQFVFVSNLSLSSRKIDSQTVLVMELHGNISHGKWVGEIRQNSVLGSKINHRLEHSVVNMVNEFIATADIDLSVPLEETNSQEQNGTRTNGNLESVDVGPSSKNHIDKGTNLTTQELESAIGDIFVNSQISELGPSPPVPSTSGWCSKTNQMKRSNDRNDLSPNSNKKFCNVQNPIDNAINKALQLQPDNAVICNYTEDYDRKQPSRTESHDTKDSCCSYLSLDYFCFSCGRSVARNLSMDQDTFSQTSTQPPNDEFFESDAVVHSVQRYLKQASTGRPGSVIAWITDFYPGFISCYSIFDMVFYSCPSCKLLRSLASQLQGKFEEFAESCKAFALKYGMDAMQLKIPCTNCANTMTDIHFHIPFVIEDIAGNKMIAVLTRNAANLFFKTNPIQSIVSDENRSTIEDFFECLRRQIESKPTIKNCKHFTLARFGDIYEIIKISDLSEDCLQKFTKINSKSDLQDG